MEEELEKPEPEGTVKSEAGAPEEIDSHEADPGILILYEDDELLHDALALPGAPVAQGANPAASAQLLKEFVFQTILGTPVDIEINCLQRTTVGGVSQLFPMLFQSLTHSQYLRVLAHLTRSFITSRSPTAQWSLAVGHSLGQLIKVTGGGTGGVYYSKITVDDGIFRSV